MLFERAVDFALGLALLYIVAAVELFFAARKSHFHFHTTSFEIELKRNESESFL